MTNAPKGNVRIMTVDLSRAAWHTSSHSGANGDCVEVARNLPAVVAVRDSKDRGGPALIFSAEAWSSFLAAAKSGGPAS